MKLNWSDIGALIKHAAPFVASALPGGGAVATLVANALGTEENPDAVAEAIKNDPEAALKLQQLENTHQEILQRIALERQAADLRDTADARARDIEVRRVTHRNIRADILAYSSMAGLVVVFFILAYVPLPQNTHDALLQLIGTLSAIVLMVFGFEFGSSQGSRLKDQDRNGTNGSK